jgi:uncharacterized protein (TIGR02757 family)
MKTEIRQQLIALASAYETESFLHDDPSRFMHLAATGADRELTAFVASCLSYGRRELFMPRIQWIVDQCQCRPSQWLRSGAFRAAVPDSSRTFYRLNTWHHLRQLLEALARLIEEEENLGCYVRKRARTGLEALQALTDLFRPWDVGQLVPSGTASACKRLCMFLRWMVRDGSPVDLGLWTFIDKRTLLIPLDAHVMHEAQRLGLIRSHTAAMGTALKLTAQLRTIFPDDPTKGDFALFGYGIDAGKEHP